MKLDGKWYYFSDGWYQTTDEFDNPIWAQSTGGYMVTGAVDIWNSDWTQKMTYFFNEDGTWDTSAGWKNDGVNWFYFNGDGTRATGWQRIGDNWYYFNLSSQT